MNDTPRTNAAIKADGGKWNFSLRREMYQLVRERNELLEALDTLTLVVGLTPIAGNKEALQEAMDIARAAIAKAKREQR